LGKPTKDVGKTIKGGEYRGRGLKKSEEGMPEKWEGSEKRNKKNGSSHWEKKN